ncbi:hypothetical protein D9757_008396 [Collybiopsis confluens]|uniref:Uncharacterized protein n=1 Tax=Collybiopsis confluens TaxID=2823264 RepID=A0A8H5HHK6_9AGAR|nr:hypothetical protein D9757_008396 [Collybiopsis confluens]
MPVGMRISSSKTPSSFSTSASQFSDEGKREFKYDLYFPARSSTGTVGGTLVDLSDQVLRTIVGVAQFTPTPYLGSLAVVALCIFNAIQGARDNQDSLKQLAHIAITSVDTVNSTYKELQQQTPTARSSTAGLATDSFSSDPTLNRHVEELLRILQKINDWVKSLTSRNILRRVVASRSDLNFIQDYKDQIKQALDKFQLQSMIILRYSVSRMAAQQQAMEQGAEHRHKSTQETLLTIHEEMKNQNLRRSTTPQVHVTDRPFSSEPSSDSSPQLSPSVNGPYSRSPTSMNPFWSQNSKNPFYQAIRNATVISGNISDQNISGDHNVNTKTDKENLGNVCDDTYNSSHSGRPRKFPCFGFDCEDEGYRDIARDERRRRVGTPNRGTTSDEENLIEDEWYERFRVFVLPNNHALARARGGTGRSNVPGTGPAMRRSRTVSDDLEDEWYERFGNGRGYGYTPDGNHAFVLPHNHAHARGSGGRRGTGRSNVPAPAGTSPAMRRSRTVSEDLDEDEWDERFGNGRGYEYTPDGNHAFVLPHNHADARGSGGRRGTGRSNVPAPAGTSPAMRRSRTVSEDLDEDEWYGRFGNGRGYGYTPDGNHAFVLPHNHAHARGSGGRRGTGRSNVPAPAGTSPAMRRSRTVSEDLDEDEWDERFGNGRGYEYTPDGNHAFVLPHNHADARGSGGRRGTGRSNVPAPAGTSPAMRRSRTVSEDLDEDEWYGRFGNGRGYGYTPDGNHAFVLPHNHAHARGSGGQRGTGRSNVPALAGTSPAMNLDEDEWFERFGNGRRYGYTPDGNHNDALARGSVWKAGRPPSSLKL